MSAHAPNHLPSEAVLAAARASRYCGNVASGETVDDALARAGWHNGATALVAAWLEHRRERIYWEETYNHNDWQRYVTRPRPGELVYIEWFGGDVYQLNFEWSNGWGDYLMEAGWLEDLQSQAKKLIRAGGPFGGPPQPPNRICTMDGGWRVAGDIELRYTILRDDLAACHFIDRDGQINNLWVMDTAGADHRTAFQAVEKLPRPAPELWVKTWEGRRPWVFTPWLPLLAHTRINKLEYLLACPDAETAVVLAHIKGELRSAGCLTMTDLRQLNADAWLVANMLRPPWKAQASPPTARGPIPPPEPRLVAPPDPALERRDEGSKLPPSNDSPPRRTPSAPAPPRFPLPPDPSEEDLERHFTEVEAHIPPRLVGSATAIEIWKAIRHAVIHDVLPITGSWVEVVAELHRHGYLAQLPADRAAREALRLLAALSPLVQRLRHRRWGIGTASLVD